MYKNIFYAGLGSNIGDKLKYLQLAVDEINNDPMSKTVAASSVYETIPFGYKDQANFYNAVIKVETDRSLQEVYTLTKGIENKIGRIKGERWGPREIDIDILFYNDVVYSDEKLNIPHIGILERDFVLVPLKEVAGDLIHPVEKKKIKEAELNNIENTVVKKLSEKLFVE